MGEKMEERCRVRMYAVALAILVAAVGHANLESGPEVHQLEEASAPELGEGRKVKVDLWSHTRGAPRGQKVHLKLPDGDSVVVAKIVARKNIERAAAGLHHAMVMMKQEKERKKVAYEQDESALTKLKVAQTKLKRRTRMVKDDDTLLDKVRTKQADVAVKATEASARVQTVSKAKKKEAIAKATDAKLNKVMNKKSADKYKLTGATADEKAEVEKEDKLRLVAVAQGVKYDAAHHAALHAKFMDLKAKNLSKLAKAKFSKEIWKKKKRQGKFDVKSAREMVQVMGSGPGIKEAKAALGRAKQRKKNAAKKYAVARKFVNKVKNKINKNEVKWARKMAYKAVWKTAKIGDEANKADKAFANALSSADKHAKKLLAESSKKEFKKVTGKAEKAKANYEHVKFAAAQSKKARERQTKKEKKKDAKAEKTFKERKRKDKMAKKAIAKKTTPLSGMQAHRPRL